MKKIIVLFTLLVFNVVGSQNFQDTKGELQITNSGTANYTIPIAIPPSINNVAPIINLVYNSGTRGGIAGQGWSINSISSITRIATRQDIDGFRDGVDFDANDKLALDGQRLLIKTGAYWGNNSVYETEYKSNTKIEYFIQGNMTFFIVTNPDGSRAWYGSTGNGTYQNSISNNAWYIVRYEDVYGNYITYNYTNVVYNSTNQLYIDNIMFSGNQSQGLAQINKIQFSYVNSSRVERDYIKGVATYATKILDKVEVFTNNTLFRKYQLTRYPADSDGYERVEQVQEFNGANEPSNPIVFEYYTTPNTTTRTEKSYDNNLNFSEVDLAGDFDGDGRLDFVTDINFYNKIFNNFPTEPIPLPSLLVGGEKRQKLATTIVINNKLPQQNSFTYAYETQNSTYFRMFNFNNSLNQFQLINVIQVPMDNNTYHDSSMDYVQYSGATSSDYDSNGLIIRNCETPTKTNSNEYLEGDFNGDGISEILVFRNVNERYYYQKIMYSHSPYDMKQCIVHTKSDSQQCFYLDLNPEISPEQFFDRSFIYLNDANMSGDKKYVADFNGDGKTDILLITNQSYKIITFNQLNVAPWVTLEVIGQGSIDKYSTTKQILFGDYNGDGKTDIMLPDTEGGSGDTLWHIYYSNPNPNGGSFFTKESFNIVEYRPDTVADYNTQRHWSTYYAMDVNKDGKSDLVRVWRKYYKPAWTINDHDTEWQVTAYTNNIGKTGATNVWPQTYNSDYYLTILGQLQLVHLHSDSPDIPIPIASTFKYNGANTDLVIVRGHYNKIEYYKFNKDFAADNRLHYVREVNNNIVHTIDYLPMEAVDGGLGNVQTDFYSSNNSVTYPNVEIIKNDYNYLVSKLTATVNNVSKYQDFRYHGYVTNFNYGSIGFKRNTRSSWYLQPSDTKIWTTENNDVSLRGANSITWTSTNGTDVFKPIPSNLLSTKTNVFATYTNPTTKVYNVLLNNQTTIDALTGVRIENNFTYDGAIDSIGTYGLQTVSETNYYNDTVLQGKKTNVTEYENNPTGSGNAYYIGKPKKISTNNKLYDVSGTTIADERTSEEKYTYEGANIIKTEKKGHNTEYLQEDMTYDGVGNLLTKTVSMPTATPSIASRTITDEYDPTKRFVTTKTDHQGFETTLAYNSLGQVTQSTNYLGVTTITAYDNWGKLTSTTVNNSSTSPLVTNIAYAKLSDGSYTVTNTNVFDNAMSRTQYDVLGRIIKTTSKGFAAGSEISKSIEYDALGRKYRESEPYFTTASKWTTYSYDYLHRPIQITLPTTRVQTLSYNGLTSTSVDDGKTTTATLNALGHKIITTDPGGTLNFEYYATGQLKKTGYEGHEITFSIDGWGNKITTHDPNAGTYTYAYDAFGQLKTETTPKGTTNYSYDDFGKLILKNVMGDGADFNTVYTYNSFAQLETETSTTTAGVAIDNYGYTYDSLHRLTSTLENNANFEHTKTIAFDNYSRVASETNYTREKSSANFSSTLVHKPVYSSYNGMLYKITDGNNVMLWQLNSANEKMQTLTAALGNGIAITNTYDSNYYFLAQQEKKNTTYILNNSYEFNNVKGNLIFRQNHSPGMGITEYFTYDNLDRLTTWTNPTTGILDSNIYDNKGRITINNKIGTVSYNTDATTGLYKKTKITLNAQGKQYYDTLGGDQHVEYTMFKSPISITESDKGKCNFEYNSHLERTKQLYDYGTIAPSTTKVQRKTKLYTDDGSTEIIYDNAAHTIKIITYIAGDAYTAVLYNDKTIDTNTNVTSENKYYLHRDYLGSIIAISDNNGVAVEKRHFDAWGNLVKIVDANNTSLPLANGLIWLDRGYTSHEHLKEVGIIHMNGRLYDPVLRSFLMPDNYVQQPENTQNYNRYAYCLNNPLRYTDPSGELFGLDDFMAVFIIGAIIGGASYTLTALLADVPFNIGGLIKGMYIGAASATVTFGIGQAAGSMFSQPAIGFWAGASQGAMTGAITGVGGVLVNTSFTGGNITLKAALQGVVIGAAVGGIIGGIDGGINAQDNNADFWSGKQWEEIKIGSIFKNLPTLPENIGYSPPNWNVDQSMKLTPVNQTTEWDCTYACKLSIDKYFGATNQTSNNIKWFNRTQLLDSNGQGGIPNSQIEGFYRASGYSTNPLGNFNQTYSPNTTLKWITDEMKLNRVVQIGWKPDGTLGHASLITRVRYLSDFSKMRINIMNPNGGLSQLNNFKLIFQIFSIWK